MAERYIANECLIFCSRYFKGVETRLNRAQEMMIVRLIRKSTCSILGVVLLKQLKVSNLMITHMLKHIAICYCIVTTSTLIWSEYHYLLKNNNLNMLNIYYILNLLIVVENFCMTDAQLIVEELLTDWKLSGL